MIARLYGIIDALMSDSMIVNVNGVGYHVFASTRTLSNAGDVGEGVALMIDTHVREDHIHLYGFTDAGEQEWFRLLNSVQGVGTRVALAILSVCPPEKLYVAIGAGDKAPIQQADGVGPKLATRILTELKDKAGSLSASTHANMSHGADGRSPLSPHKDKGDSGQGAGQAANDDDAVSALVNLGYGRSDAFSAVMQARRNNGDSDPALQTLIRLALKELSA
jgi:Holliday junction DNA helicase RuvA